MIKAKFWDIGFFVLLTWMHVCSVLQPVIEAHANFKSVYPSVDRNLMLQLSYTYNPWILVKAMMYSLLVMIGLWYSRQLQTNVGQASEEKRDIPKAPEPKTANEVKKVWLSRNTQSSETELGPFPVKNFLLFAMPWLLTFVASGLINYLRFYMVIQHFCISNWRAIQLYGELQVLFLHRFLAVAWLQITGGGGASSLPRNFINFETHLLD
ncbi:hypothetical protein M5D96_006214 [Drosophila gunungcola]|uniref:Uncharacterized protein n=1 Tax=Drosophila gunungcola TaxID=103775 RepID=A0A9P9YPK4_9MUSC|nr:hypothetical protein M5D96_006214 [Drosophila gunungcola]